MATEPIGTLIKKRRQVMGMTQDDLAHRLGVAKSTVANWERGKHFPLRKLGAVEAVLGISLDGSADGQADVYTDPDEAALWALDRFPEAERRKLIAALREARARQRAG